MIEQENFILYILFILSKHLCLHSLDQTEHSRRGAEHAERLEEAVFLRGPCVSARKFCSRVPEAASTDLNHGWPGLHGSKSRCLLFQVFHQSVEKAVIPGGGEPVRATPWSLAFPANSA
jgi:hypothetical protein